MENRVTRNIYFLLSGPIGVFFFIVTNGWHCLRCVVIEYIETGRRIKQQDTELTRQSAQQVKPDNSVSGLFWQLENKVKDQYPGYTCSRHGLAFTAASSMQEGQWGFDTKLYSSSTEIEETTKGVSILFEGHKLIGITGHITKPAILDSEQEYADELEEAGADPEPDPKPEMVPDKAPVCSSETMGVYAEMYLRENQLWLEAQCQNAHAQHAMCFVIPPKHLPEERELWPYVRDLLIGDRYEYSSADILACNFGIEVWLPAPDPDTTPMPADDPLAQTEPSVSDDDIPTQEDLKQLTADPAYSVAEGTTVPLPDEEPVFADE